MADAAVYNTDKHVCWYDAININARLFILLTTLTIYAFLGEPTPGYFGLPECLVALGLMVVVGAGNLASCLRFTNMQGWQICGVLFLVYGMCMATLNGLLRGNALSLMLRDIVPFLFLFLPLFLARYASRLSLREACLLTGFIAFVGVMFATRVVMPVLSDDVAQVIDMMTVQNPALLANAPTVLFAAVITLGLAGYKITQGFTVSNFIKMCVLLFLTAIPMVAMAVIQQRASVAYLTLCVCTLLAVGVWQKPYRMAFPVIIGALAVYMLAPFWMGTLDTLAHKHAAVGLNMRGQEAAAVMEAVGGNIQSILFGNGWGATIASPAVGGAVVNFTHSLVTATWLKTGIVGVVLLFAYMGGLAMKLFALLRTRIVLALAIAGPFAIDVFLYASYKSLDFGLLLLLIPLWVDRAVLLKKNTVCST